MYQQVAPIEIYVKRAKQGQKKHTKQQRRKKKKKKKKKNALNKQPYIYICVCTILITNFKLNCKIKTSRPGIVENHLQNNTYSSLWTSRGCSINIHAIEVLLLYSYLTTSGRSHLVASLVRAVGHRLNMTGKTRQHDSVHGSVFSNYKRCFFVYFIVFLFSFFFLLLFLLLLLLFV